jgi:TatD DNase family protein
MQFDYFDIHSHIYFPDYDKDREEEIRKMEEAKIGTITVGTDFTSSQKAIEIAEKNKNFFACIGQHPGDLNKDSVFDEKLALITEKEKVVAIGECGLDYFRLPREEKERELAIAIQKNIFQRQIDLSLSANLPLMLHIRSTPKTHDAYEDTLKIIENYHKTYGSKLRGNTHFFAGNLEILRRFLDLGFTASFTGVITFARDYDELINFMPRDMILSETDAPFVAPVPYRSKRNSPFYIGEIVKKMAEIRGENEEELKVILVNNAKRVFKI